MFQVRLHVIDTEHLNVRTKPTTRNLWSTLCGYRKQTNRQVKHIFYYLLKSALKDELKWK